MTGTQGPSGDGGASPAPCPVCGQQTAVTRDAEVPIAALGWSELDTLVRNEWRRRLGPSAYERPHDRSFIRAVVRCALAPDDAHAQRAFREALWSEVALLEVWGLGRRPAELELYRLIQSISSVLGDTLLTEERRHELMERLDRRLRDELDWPAEEWRELQETEGSMA